MFYNNHKNFTRISHKGQGFKQRAVFYIFMGKERKKLLKTSHADFTGAHSANSATDNSFKYIWI